MTGTKNLGIKQARREEDDSKEIPSIPVWKVVRLAAKDRERRKKEGGDLKCQQQKVSCEKLEILQDGVQGTAKGLFGVTQYMIRDYNHYRTQGHSGRFEAGTNERAVFIATVAAYDLLQTALDKSGQCKIKKGDLGENILIDAPTALGGKNNGGLCVGAKVRIGSALVELTEANNPCYRFNTQSWASQAQKLWGNTAPDGNAAKWFKSPDCPLNHEVNPGVRGWLAKVLEEGEILKGDQAQLVVVEKEEETKEETGRKPEDIGAEELPPTKRPRLST